MGGAVAVAVVPLGCWRGPSSPSEEELLPRMKLADRGNRIATDELGRRRRSPSQVRGRAAALFRPPACGSGRFHGLAR